MDTKNAFTSMTNWGGFVALVLGLLPVFGVHLTDAQYGMATQAALVVVAFAVTIYGRIRAGATPMQLFGVLLMTVQHATDLLNAMPPSLAPATPEPVATSQSAPAVATSDTVAAPPPPPDRMLGGV